MLKQKRSGERQVALFLLGVLLLFPPVLQIFNKPSKVFGIPVLYFYIFVVWALLIGCTLLITRRMRLDEMASSAAPPSSGDEAQRSLVTPLDVTTDA